MAAEPASSGESKDSYRWWFLPSWLGLDAPCVVSTWTWAVSQAAQRTPHAPREALHLAERDEYSGAAMWSFRPVAAMFLVVWAIYLLDRLIDVARCADWHHATGRLRFGRRYRPLFLVCCSLCFLGIVALLLAGLPEDVVRRASYVALGLAGYFFAYVVPLVTREKLPGKEFGVGLFFALGTDACLGCTAEMLPLLVSEALVVTYNCLVIAARDAASDRANDPGGASRWWRTIKRDLFWTGAGLTIAYGLWAIFAPQPTFFIAITAAFLGLTALHRHSQRFSGDAVRALADFALFTPILVMGLASF